MRKALLYGLWLLMCLVIVGAFLWAPIAKGFLGESSRILFFHVPMAWTAFLAFIAAGIWSLLYLIRGRGVAHDHAALAAVELGLVFCLLATVTGAMWAKTMWGAFWNWDPRQISITFALLFYGAYLALRSSVPDPQVERVLGAAYAVFGLVMAPFLFFVAPRLVFSLHPQPVLNTQGKVEMESRMLWVLAASSLAFTCLFVWLLGLRRRMLALADRIEES
ncbi:MAG TPA: cytochrome c biogenesis protein CcsA [Thermoanaerobaculia bacterium]|nr:cytochrome c biogenesis protein CcsA [Thermoanaerobaculia bacterium]